MAVSSVPLKAAKLEIQAYKKPKNYRTLSKTHVAFTGSPQIHRYDPDKIILVADPFSVSTFYFEFDKGDISYAEELPNLVNVEGEIITMVRVWVKKRSIAIQCTPFLVGDTAKKADL
jgi:inorganic pyrophosphatase